MCVIIYKPKGVKMPSIELLDKAHIRNPHGCGLVSPSAFYKGLSYDVFKKLFKKCSENEPLLIHFRYATHGSVKRSNSHPFVDDKSGVIFMHNGVLSGIRVHDDKTDSEIAFKEVLVPIIERYGLGSAEFKSAAQRIIGSSKFAFMDGDNVLLMGDYIKSGGLYFSNLRFL